MAIADGSTRAAHDHGKLPSWRMPSVKRPKKMIG